MRRFSILFAAALLSGALPAAASPRPIPPQLYSGLRWRNIGPFRAGWSTCVAGVPDRPDTFYFGAAGGGVWKTDDAGRTWQGLFQNEGSASVGALAIAPSDPRILYAGTGQVTARYDIASGDGVYRSADGGRTWTHAGLRDSGAIGRFLIDPRDPDVVLAAAFGHVFGPNPERGVFRTEDGGKTWTRTLFVDEDTGAVDLASDPADPSLVYAATWQDRNYPWLSYFQPSLGPGSGVFKSSDGGKTWTRIRGNGWPSQPLGRIGLAAAPGGLVYAVVDAQVESGNVSHKPAPPSPGGLFRSDDAGATWTRTSDEDWLENDYFGRITVDPGNRDRLYATGQSIRMSADGGKTWTIVKGSPGGDDYHFLWINPKHTDHMAVASDQGTVVSVNGGETWSSWYNQPTGQFYHLAADDRFPYWIYSGQQDSGTVGIASRSDYGALSYREWHPVGGDERDYDVPDPSDPNIVYGSGLGGSLARFDARTGQVAAISPHVESTYARNPTSVKYRYTWITPIAVSPRPPHAIYQGAQLLFRSADRGQSWTVVSPDLSGAVSGARGCGGPATLESARACGFGVIYTIALGPTDDVIWVGTDDGRIQVTRDGGKSWNDVTPPGLRPWSKIATLDVSPLDPDSVYAAVDTHRLDDFSPHAYRTRDGGRTWTQISAGLPKGGFVDVVRADPERRGLLYAGTDTGVFVSFDDGDHWQTLKLDLPTVWVRDLLVHGRDLVAATQGRAIWILDDLSPLRQITPEAAEAKAHLFRPATAYRLRRDENRDTPPPPETPLGKNPPAGAVIDYTLASAPPGPVTLEILDSAGNSVRRFASDQAPARPEAERYFAASWLKPFPTPSAAAGHHRFVWDLRGERPRAISYDYSIAAVWGDDTPALPEGALVPPGEYTVRLSVGAQVLQQPLKVEMDPRVSAAPAAIAEQHAAAGRAATLMARSYDAFAAAREFRKRLAARGRLSGSRAALDRKAAALEEGHEGFRRINEHLSAIYRAIEGADFAPTKQALEELEETARSLDRALERWKELERSR
jgi:photosystem II stability/assembly factor-like uncharacterized protein